jgi:hypothetical protein
MYSWASEVFATICAAIFFPVNLEQLARENGVYAYDRLTPCTADLNITSHSLATSVSTSMFSDMSLSALGATEDKTRCVVHFLGITWMDSSSFALYTFSISTFLQAVLVVSMSGAADYGNLSFYWGGTNDRPLSENVFDVVFDHFVDFNCGIRCRRGSWTVSLPPRFSVRHILKCISPSPCPKGLA